MVYYDQNQRPDDAEKPPGCLDALVITRVVFSILFWPVAILIGVMLSLAVALYLFTVHPLLGLIPIAFMVGAIMLYARWEQRHYSSPDL